MPMRARWESPFRSDCTAEDRLRITGSGNPPLVLISVPVRAGSPSRTGGETGTRRI